MMYLKYILLVLVDLTVSFLNFFRAPVVVLAADDSGYLPAWLSWFQTPDDSLDHDYGDKRFPGLQTGWRRWYSRVAWLYRNSMYGFAINVLGAKTRATDVLQTRGDVLTSNCPIHSGWLRYDLYRDGKRIHFQFYYVKQWAANRCIRINLGWKLWTFAEGESTPCQLVFSPNPLMGLST